MIPKNSLDNLSNKKINKSSYDASARRTNTHVKIITLLCLSWVRNRSQTLRCFDFIQGKYSLDSAPSIEYNFHRCFSLFLDFL